jgi:alcohol dehydrogenase class IV
MAGVNPFSLEMPRTIHFGAGTLEKLPPIARELGRRVLLVTGGRSFDDSPRLAGLAALEGCTVERLRCPSGEPTEKTIDQAAEAASAFAPDVIVAAGGGSVLDTAKAVSALVRHRGPCRRFLEGVEGATAVPGPGVPWIAVPTTAGTGAEATKNAVVMSHTAGAKRSMRSPHLLAHAVIVDPLLTLSLPASVTGASGLDALTQLVEAYVTRAANPVVSSLIEGAFAGMLDALERLPGSPLDVGLRTRASYGSLVSGIALANAGLGAAHGLAAAVGARGVPHGLACAVFLPHVLAANASVIRDMIERLAATCGGAPVRGDAVGWLSSRVVSLLHAFGLPTDLRGFGIDRGKIPDLAVKAAGSSMRGNPRELSAEEREGILAKVLEGSTGR